MKKKILKIFAKNLEQICHQPIVVILLEFIVETTQKSPVRLKSSRRILEFISHFINVIDFSLSNFYGTISRFF